MSTSHCSDVPAEARVPDDFRQRDGATATTAMIALTLLPAPDGRLPWRRSARPTAAPLRLYGLVLCQRGHVHPDARDQRQTGASRRRVSPRRQSSRPTSAFWEGARQDLVASGPVPARAIAQIRASRCRGSHDCFAPPVGSHRTIASATIHSEGAGGNLPFATKAIARRLSPRRSATSPRESSSSARAYECVRGRLSEYRCRLPGLRHFSVWLEISFRVSAASCC